MCAENDLETKASSWLDPTASRASGLAEVEVRLEEDVKRAARQRMRKCLDALAERTPARTTRCRNCGEEANYVHMRAGLLRSRFGLLRYRRAFYVCPHCHKSTCPLDERLDPARSLGRLRSRVLAGQRLPVEQMARAWGLGSLHA